MAEIDWTKFVMPEEPEAQAQEDEIDWTAYVKPEKKSKPKQPRTFNPNLQPTDEDLKLTALEKIAKFAGPAIAQTSRFGAAVPASGGKLYGAAGSIVDLLTSAATGGVPRLEPNPVSQALYKKAKEGKELSEKMAAPAKEFADTKLQRAIQDVGQGGMEWGLELPAISKAGLPLYSGLTARGEAKASGASDAEADLSGLGGVVSGAGTHALFGLGGELPGKVLPKAATAATMGLLTKLGGGSWEETGKEMFMAGALTKGKDKRPGPTVTSTSPKFSEKVPSKPAELEASPAGRVIGQGEAVIPTEPLVKEVKAPEKGASGVEPPTVTRQDVAERPSTAKDKGLSIEELRRTPEVVLDDKLNVKYSGTEGDQGVANLKPNETSYRRNAQTGEWEQFGRGRTAPVTDTAILDTLNKAKPKAQEMKVGEFVAEKDVVIRDAEGNPVEIPAGEVWKKRPAADPEYSMIEDGEPALVKNKDIDIALKKSMPVPAGTKAAVETERKISQVVNVEPTKSKPNTVGTFTKEFGKENALELAKDFAEYNVRDPNRAPEELARDGIENTINKLINKDPRDWDEYDFLKANKIRETAPRLSVGEMRQNTRLLEIMKRSKEGWSARGKELQAAAEVNPIDNPIRAAERITKEIINKAPRLKGKQIDAENKTKRIKEKINDINKETIKKKLPEIVKNVKKLIPRLSYRGNEKVIEDGYKQNVFDFVMDWWKKNPSKRYKIAQHPKTAAEILEQRVSNRFDPLKTPSEQAVLIRDMVNTVYDSIKSTLPEMETATIDRRQININTLKARISRSTEYSAALTNAQRLLKTKYAKNQEALKALDGLFNADLLKPATDKIIDSLIKKELDFSGVKISELIRKHYTEVDKTGKNLAEKIMDGLELNETDAAAAARYIHNGFDVLTRNAKSKVLENMLGKNRQPKGEKDLTQKIIELSNVGALNESQFADIVAKKIGVPVLTPEHMVELSKQSERVQLANGEAKIDEIGKLYAMLYPDVPKTRWQKAWDVRVLGMLFNAKTVERNMFGQGFDTIATSFAKDTIGVTADKWIANRLSKVIGEPPQRTMVKTDWGYIVNQGVKSGKMGVSDVKKRIDTTKARIEYLTGTKLGKEADKFGLGKDEWKPGSLMDKVQKGVAVGLQVPDRMFQEAVYWESYLNQIKALGPKGKVALSPETRQNISAQAWSEASQITYRKMNKFSTAIVDLQKKMGPIGKLLLTFPKVASNIVYTGAYKYSPVGLGVGLNKARKFIKSGGTALDRSGKPMNQRQISFDIARGGIGSSVTLLGMLLGYLGTATAARDSDQNVQLTKEAIGEQPGSIRLFGHTVRVDWIQPLSIPLELGVQIGAALKNKKNGADLLESATDVLMGAATAIVDQPLFTGLQRAVSVGGKSPGEKAFRAAGSIATAAAASWIPTLSGQARQAIDPYQRQLNRKFGEGAGNSLKSFGFAAAALVANKVPFISTLLEKRKNIFGQDIKYHQSGNLLFDVLDRFLNPAIISDLKKEPGIDFVLQLNRDKPSDMSEKPLPRRTDKTEYIKQDGVKYFFTPDQKSQYQELVGQAVYDYINEYYNEKQGENKTVEEQIKEIYGEISRIGNEKREELLDEMSKE
jgi:hypothetical protein